MQQTACNYLEKKYREDKEVYTATMSKLNQAKEDLKLGMPFN
jgi:hypothetical protein